MLSKVKKHKKKLIVIISILLLIVIGFIIYNAFLTPKLENTTWKISNLSSDNSENTEENYSNMYYTFDSNNKIYINLGSSKVSGTWKYVNNNTLKINITNFMEGKYTYSFSGNFFSGYTLSLKSENYSFYLEPSSIPDLNLSPYEKFEENADLTGEWKQEKSNVTYTFYEDGVCKINNNDDFEINGVYTYSKDTIKIAYYSENEVCKTESLSYTINKNKLKLGKNVYIKQ